jgi:hypothetical protein
LTPLDTSGAVVRRFVPPLLQHRRHRMLHRFKPVVLAAIVLLFLMVLAPIVGMACDKALAFDMATVVLGTRPGVGDVGRAQRKIKDGMSKDEVRLMLGIPHVDGGNEWDYWEHRFVGSILRVHFGPDDRVASSEWWVQ